MSGNKVRFGLKNVHWSEVIENIDGSLTFGTVYPWKGAVSLTLEPQGDPVEFYADDGIYYEESTNNGYSGTLEAAEVPDQFREEVLGEQNINGVQYEKAGAKTKKFALMYQFDGDKRATRHVNYYCSAARPTVGSTTKTNATEVQTTSMTFTSRPRPDNGLVKAKATADAPIAIYNNWFKSVHEKPADVGAESVKVEPSAATLSVGGQMQLLSTVLPADATYKAVSFESSDEEVATVDNTGKVTAIGTGTATITVTTVDGGHTDTCAITVS